jgi:hypothetical protein
MSSVVELGKKVRGICDCASIDAARSGKSFEAYMMICADVNDDDGDAGDLR